LLKRTSDKTETARGASRGGVGDVSDFRSREHSNHLAIPLLLTVQTRMDNYPVRFGSPLMLDVKFTLSTFESGLINAPRGVTAASTRETLELLTARANSEPLFAG
jgi:hypothetical protein